MPMDGFWGAIAALFAIILLALNEWVKAKQKEEAAALEYAKEKAEEDAKIAAANDAAAKQAVQDSAQARKVENEIEGDSSR